MASMPASKSKVILLLVVGTCVLLWALWRGLSNRLDSSNFGKAEITLANGAKVYVIHEQWGWHSSGNEISVTRNPDGCVPPNPATDYIDTYGDGKTLVYSVTPGGLILYDDFDPAASMHEPITRWSDINVSVQKTRNLESMVRNPKAYGVTVAEVPLNETCWKNFFRKAGTSLRNGR
jgi:hypothetical protein